MLLPTNEKVNTASLDIRARGARGAQLRDRNNLTDLEITAEDGLYLNLQAIVHSIDGTHNRLPETEIEMGIGDVCVYRGTLRGLAESLMCE